MVIGEKSKGGDVGDGRVEEKKEKAATMTEEERRVRAAMFDIGNGRGEIEERRDRGR